MKLLSALIVSLACILPVAASATPAQAARHGAKTASVTHKAHKHLNTKTGHKKHHHKKHA